MTILTKDPGDSADFAVDFAQLLATAETISNPTVVVPAGITLTPSGKPAPAISGSKVVFWISGGTLNGGAGPNGEYPINVACDTSGGRHFTDNPNLYVFTRR